MKIGDPGKSGSTGKLPDLPGNKPPEAAPKRPLPGADVPNPPRSRKPGKPGPAEPRLPKLENPTLRSLIPDPDAPPPPPGRPMGGRPGLSGSRPRG